jgi:homospermidine synthase
MAGKNYAEQSAKRLIVDEVVSGVDELGVLLMGTHLQQPWAYWYGSLLDIETARRLAPHNNATSLQVVAPVLAGILWARDNPQKGIVESDEMPWQQILEVCDPYLGSLVGEFTNWTPLQDRNLLFAEDLDETDPWQFKNFRVN